MGVLKRRPTLQASSDIDPLARDWCLRYSAWPKVLFDDMCAREGGKSFDLLSNTSVLLQSSTLLSCGFPCQPFSTRRGDKSETFLEEKAKPYFALLDEIRSKRHDSVLAENVLGLARGSASKVRAQTHRQAASHASTGGRSSRGSAVNFSNVYVRLT